MVRHREGWRWVAKAVAPGFAHRLATPDLTGVASNTDNEKGLADAHHWLVRLSA